MLSPWPADFVIADQDVVEYMPARTVTADAIPLAWLHRQVDGVPAAVDRGPRTDRPHADSSSQMTSAVVSPPRAGASRSAVSQTTTAGTVGGLVRCSAIGGGVDLARTGLINGDGQSQMGLGEQDVDVDRAGGRVDGGGPGVVDGVPRSRANVDFPTPHTPSTPTRSGCPGYRPARCSTTAATTRSRTGPGHSSARFSSSASRVIREQPDSQRFFATARSYISRAVPWSPRPAAARPTPTARQHQSLSARARP
jgi:hypothetical protein